MISKNDIVSMARAVSRGVSHSRNRALTHPHRDWILGLLGAFLLTACGVGANAYLFQYYGNIESNVVANEPTTVEYQKKQIEQILEEEGIRSGRYEELREELPDRPFATSSSAVAEEEGVATTTSEETLLAE